ncbi:hypothetical protein VTI74DRAFT_695 [Chaetomium olivicolor]
MLCGIDYPKPHSTHRRFLRSLRSYTGLGPNHKNSTINRNTDSIISSTNEEMHHRHLHSDASSLARPSLESSTSRRPSVSSGADTTMSVDWDPLRLHPPLAPGPSPPLRDAFDESVSRPYQPQELRHARTSHNLRQPPRPSYQSLSAAANTVIYDGFDFGFDNDNNKKPTPISTPTPAVSTSTTPRHPRAPSPTPSDASSECSLTFSSRSSSTEDDSPFELGMGLTPAPVRSRPAAQPQARHTVGKSGPDGAAPGSIGMGMDDDADYFLRRGGWKRRGIVFVVPEGEEEAGEEECWEI